MNGVGMSGVGVLDVVVMMRLRMYVVGRLRRKLQGVPGWLKQEYKTSSAVLHLVAQQHAVRA